MQRMRENAIVVPVSAVRRVAIVALILIAVVLLILVARAQLSRGAFPGLLSPSVSDQIDKNSYQAVFLNGGQVFFGRLSQQGDEYFVLNDVFYLSAPDQAGQQGQLVKRGREIQGPREPLIIPARNVLFIENLRDDGDVATAIRKFKAGELPLATPSPALPTTPAPPAPSTPRPSVTPTPTR